MNTDRGLSHMREKIYPFAKMLLEETCTHVWFDLEDDEKIERITDLIYDFVSQYEASLRGQLMGTVMKIEHEKRLIDELIYPLKEQLDRVIKELKQ